MLRSDEIRTRLYLKAIESMKVSPNTQLNRQIKGAIKNHRKRERKKSKTVGSPLGETAKLNFYILYNITTFAP